MSEAEQLQDQLATDLAWMMGGAVYGLLVAPTLVRWAYMAYVWVVLRRRRRRGAPRALGGRLRMRPRLEAAMAEFRLPFALRVTLRERLLKAQVLATATAVVIGCPALTLFNLTTLDAHAADGKIPGLSALITTVAAVLLFALTAVGGATRVYGPRLGLPVTRMVCNALITAHRVRRREASPSRLAGAVDGVAAVLVHRAKKYHVRQERAATVEHAKRVREALRRDARRVQRGDADAVDALAGKLVTVLHGLCAGTPQNLLPESLLVSQQVAQSEPRKRVAGLAALGVVLGSALACLLSTVGVPGEAVAPLTIVTLVLPLKLGGRSEPLLRARDLLDFARGDSEPPVTARREPEERQPATARRA